MPSTQSGNEPLTTTSLAPSDNELFRGGWQDLGLEFNSPRGHDPQIVGEEIRDKIIEALHEVGDHEIAGRLR